MRLFFHFILVVVSLYMYGNAPKSIDEKYMVECFIVALLSILQYFFFKKKPKNRLIITHSLLFTIAFVAVFYQFDIDYVLGLVDMTLDPNKLTVYSDTVVCRALCMANIALNCFFLGLCINENKPYKAKKTYKFVKYDANLTKISCFLLVVYLLTVNKQYLFNGYAKGYDPGYIATLTMMLLQATLIAFTVMRCYECRRDRLEIKKIAVFWKIFRYQVFIGLIIAGLIIMSGRRTEAVSVLLTMFFGFVYVYSGKIPIVRMIIGVLVFSLLFSFLSFYRTINGGDSSEAIEAIANISSVFPPTKELAFNASSLHIVLANVPNHADYNYGTSFFPGFLRVIPGLQNLFYSLANLPLVDSSSAYFCTIYGNGDLSWGLGTSCVADVYLSFGLFGVIFVFILWGKYIGFLERVSFADFVNPFLLVLALCTFKELIYISRASFPYCLNAYTYSFLLVYLHIKKK